MTSRGDPSPTGLGLSAVDAARMWLGAAERVEDVEAFAWDARIAGVPIRFRCTDPALAALYASRLMPDAGVQTRAPTYRLDLLETERLGWPHPDAVMGRREDPVAEAESLARAGLGALMPAPTADERDFPWVVHAPNRRRGVMLVPSARALPPWTHGAPFALALHLLFAWRGGRLLHAASLGSDGWGALLAGPGGVGKSGTTLAGLAHEMVTTGDDYVLVEPGNVPTARPVYRVLKQDPAGLDRIGRPELAAQGVNWNGKVEVDLDAAFPAAVTDTLRLRAILLPWLTGDRRTSLRRAAPTEAFSAIAGSALVQLPGARRSGFSFLTRLTRTLPAYHLGLSTDPSDVARAVLEAIAQ